MKSSFLFNLILLLTLNTMSQFVESEFPKLIFKGTLESVTPTGKAHQSYIFTMTVDEVIQGKYKEKEINFECHADYCGNNLLEYFNCITKNADSPFSCSGSGKVVLFERNFRGEIIYLFQSIEPLKK